MALRIPIAEVDNVGAAVRTGPVKLSFLGRSEAESLLPFFLFVESVGVGIRVRGFVPHEAHEPFGGFALDLEGELALELAQPVVDQIKRDEDDGDAFGDEPFITDVAWRPEDESLLPKLIIELMDERLDAGPLNAKPELRDFLFQQILVAQMHPVSDFHRLSLCI